MPLKRILSFAMFSIVAFATARYAYEFYQTESHRVSTPKAKFKNNRSFTFSNGQFHGKTSGVFQVESEVQKRDDRQILIFTVLAKQDVPAARLQWHIPEAVRVLGGAVTLALTDMKGGEVQKFELEVASLNRTPAFAEIFTMVEGVKTGATAPFADSSMKVRLQNREGTVRALSAEEKPKLVQ